jgi:hypothetical protein
MVKKKFEFDVALSFAGEDRKYANRLAKALTAEGIRVFYDKYEQNQLWGKDLYQHLQTVYRDKARFCVIFASRAYARKLWTKHELKQAQERAFRESREYILPLRLDDTKIPGVPETVGYLDLRSVPVSDVVAMLVDKVRGSDPFADPPRWNGAMVTYRKVSMPASGRVESERLRSGRHMSLRLSEYATETKMMITGARSTIHAVTAAFERESSTSPVATSRNAPHAEGKR